MSKNFELIYSQQRTDFLPGKAYSNPRFFTSPRQGVTKVYLVGDWPKVRAAYEAQGVPVETLDPGRAIRGEARREPVERRAPADLTPTVPEDERAAVYIPDDWRDLGWTKPTGDRDITLRGLAAMFSAEPVLNKAQAVEAIEGELKRRAGE